MNKLFLASTILLGLCVSACGSTPQSSFAQSDEAYQTATNAYPANDSQAYLDAHGYFLTKERHEDLGYSTDLGKYAVFNISMFQDENGHSAVGAKLLVEPKLISSESCSPGVRKSNSQTSEKTSGEATSSQTSAAAPLDPNVKKSAGSSDVPSDGKSGTSDVVQEKSAPQGRVAESNGTAASKVTCANTSSPVRSSLKIPQMWLVNEFSNVDTLIVDLTRIRPGDLVLKASLEDGSVIEHELTELPTRQKGGVIDIILKLTKAAQTTEVKRPKVDSPEVIKPEVAKK